MSDSISPDAIAEQMAQSIVYHTEVAAAQTPFLAAQGYTIGAPIHGPGALVMRVFTPTRDGLPPIVAFRGTVFTKIQALLADLDTGGIGHDQFEKNRALVEKTLTAAATMGRVTVCGHSLGGALAQRAASAFPSLCGRVVTFHTPGIESKTVAALRSWNAQHPARAIASAHYQMRGDVVGQAGDAFTDGTIHLYKLDGANDLQLAEFHSTYILADEASARGATLPACDNGRHVTLIGDSPSTSKTSTPIEKLRTLVGSTVENAVSVGTAVTKAADEVKDGAKKAADEVKDGAKKAANEVKDGAKTVAAAVGKLSKLF